MGVNLADLSDQIFKLQGQIDEINAKAAAKTKPLKEKLEPLEDQLQAAMVDAGVTEIKGKNSKAKLSEKLRVSFSDFEAFAAWCIRKKALHIFERRISGNPYKELKEAQGGKPIPGLAEFVQKSLNVNKA